MKDLMDLTLKEIVQHTEFVSLERVFTRYTSLGMPVKDPNDPNVLYKVTFESNRKDESSTYWLTCEDRRIATKYYDFHTYLKNGIS